MRLLNRKIKSSSTGTDLALLLLASLACVVVLTLAISDGRTISAGGLQMRHLLIFSIVAGAAMLAGLVVWSATRYAKQLARRSMEEASALRKDLSTAEAIIKAEPQVLMFWEQGKELRIVTHTLQTVSGLPTEEAGLMRFGQWLDSDAARELKEGLDKLFDDGRPFNLLLKTAAGAYLEADGQAAGGRAILRLRDVAAYKGDLIKVLDQHRKLSRSIRSSHELLNALPMPVWLKDGEGRIEWVNKAYVRSVEAASDVEVTERQIELLEQRQREEIQRALPGNEPLTSRIKLIVGGEQRTHDVMMVPFNDAVAAAAIDVEAIVSAQGDLDRQVAAYDRTLHRLATAAAIFGPDQRLAFFNDAYVQLWQLDAAWLETKPSDGEILDRLHELHRLPTSANYRKWKAKVLNCYTSDAVLDKPWHLPDGRTVHVMGEQRPDGGVTYLYEDVTERIALESRFNSLIDVQRETLNHLKEGVALFATDGRLKLFNSAFSQIWKLQQSQLSEGPHIQDVIRQCTVLYEDTRSWSRISHSVTAISDTRQTVVGQMVRRDNSVIDYATLPMPDGATLITFVDVSASKREERALIERNEALIAADRLKSQFISHVSYELRTPLTNIIGFSELLESPRTGDLNDKQREYLGDISVSSRQLLSIIDDILDLATIDAGALELSVAPVEVRPIIEAAVLGVRERIARDRLNLDISIADDVVDFIADENRIRQVLYNLLSNAIGFSNPGGAIKLDCWRDNGMMAFSISDEGVGIPEDQLRRVLERFESNSRGSNHRGAGLGLSVVKSLVELHGGNMSLESEPDQGTTVTVRLPEAGLRGHSLRHDASELDGDIGSAYDSELDSLLDVGKSSKIAASA